MGAKDLIGLSTKRGKGVRGFPLKKKNCFKMCFLFFLFLAVLLTTKPREGRLKALVNCPLKKNFVFAASLMYSYN